MGQHSHHVAAGMAAAAAGRCHGARLGTSARTSRGCHHVNKEGYVDMACVALFRLEGGLRVE
eukprot:2847550-Pyramimonas_sp.AAC.1